MPVLLFIFRTFSRPSVHSLAAYKLASSNKTMYERTILTSQCIRVLGAFRLECYIIIMSLFNLRSLFFLSRAFVPFNSSDQVKMLLSPLIRVSSSSSFFNFFSYVSDSA
jgi:hypothetical protein